MGSLDVQPTEPPRSYSYSRSDLPAYNALVVRAPLYLPASSFTYAALSVFFFLAISSSVG